MSSLMAMAAHLPFAAFQQRSNPHEDQSKMGSNSRPDQANGRIGTVVIIVSNLFDMNLSYGLSVGLSLSRL